MNLATLSYMQVVIAHTISEIPEILFNRIVVLSVPVESEFCIRSFCSTSAQYSKKSLGH